MMLGDYLTDDMCYEFGYELISKATCDSYDENEIESMRDSLITLASAAIISREEMPPITMTNMTIMEILRNCFNDSTEKTKGN